MKGKRIGKRERFAILNLQLINCKSKIADRKSQGFLPEAQMNLWILAGLLARFSGQTPSRFPSGTLFIAVV